MDSKILDNIAKQFQQNIEQQRVHEKEQSYTKFAKKVCKKIGSYYNIPSNQIEEMFQNSEEDPVAEIRVLNWSPVFNKVHVCAQRLTLFDLMKDSFRKSDIWKTFMIEAAKTPEEYSVVVFRVKALKEWVLTAGFSSKRHTGVPRIVIPGNEQYSDLEILPLEKFLEEI